MRSLFGGRVEVKPQIGIAVRQKIGCRLATDFLKAVSPRAPDDEHVSLPFPTIARTYLNARTLLERRKLLGQLGIYFQLADFPRRLIRAGAADDQRDPRRKLRR